MPTSPTLERAFAAAVAAVAAIMLAAATLISVTLPYGGWDSLYYGSWSRLIGLHGGFHYPGVGAVDLHRPLFYVLQGELWHVFGFHEALGRLLSLLFTVVFVVAVVRIAWHWGGLLSAAAAAAVALAVTDVAVHVSDGLTDVPVAAMLAVVAAVCWTMPPSSRRSALLAGTALLAVLAKSSGIVGCLALCLAELLGPTTALRARVRTSIAPIAAGVVLGLAYDWTQARHVHTGLRSFLQSGVGAGLWAQKSAAARPEALWGWMWLGRPLHLLLVFAVAYAVLRVCRLQHRPAVLVAAPVSWIWAWVGPVLAGHAFHAGLSLSGVASYLVALGAPAAALAPPDRVPSRVRLGRLLVWAAPTYVVWAEYAAYDTRLLSAAWPALVLLLAGAVVAIVAGLERVSVPGAALAAAAVVVLALVNVVSINGLGKGGWHQYRSGGVGGIADGALMRNVAYGQFEYELAGLRLQLRPRDRVWSEDARLLFFFPGRVTYDNLDGCADLAGYRALVLLFDDETIAGGGAPATAAARCGPPRPHAVAQIDGSYTVYTLGPPRVHPPLAACGAEALPAGTAAIFGSATTRDGAQRIVDRVRHFGFVQVEVLKTGCDRFLAVEPGLTEEQARGTVADAARVPVHVSLRAVSAS